MRRDSIANTVLVATTLCIVCSVIVATAAVQLRGIQKANQLIDQRKNVLIAAGLFNSKENSLADVEPLFDQYIERELIELGTGKVVGPSEVDPEQYSQRDAPKDPELSEPVEPREGLGGIKRREKYSFVYLVRSESGEIEQVVLPVYGKGLWSTLYGFLAIDTDGETVRGISFYEHGETPGLGAEVENPRWQEIWNGKKLYNEEGEPVIRVTKGKVSESAPDAEHYIDGLSGATITSNGVTQLVQYWVGPHAFGPYLKQLQNSGEGEPNG